MNKDSTGACTRRTADAESNKLIEELLVVNQNSILEIAEDMYCGEIKNFGKISVLNNVKISARRIENFGEIYSEFSNLTLELSDAIEGFGGLSAPNGEITIVSKTDSFSMRRFNGLIFSRNSISITTESDLSIVGCRLASETVRFVSEKGAVRVHAESISGAVHVKAETISVGVKEGNLDLKTHCVVGDPIYYSHTGDVNIPLFSPTNADLVALAGGNITSSSNIDVSGGSAGGRIILAAGVVFTVEDLDEDGSVICTDCSELFEISDEVSETGGSVNLAGINLVTNSSAIRVIARKNEEIGGQVFLGAVSTAGAVGDVGGQISIVGDTSVTVAGVIDARGSGAASADIEIQSPFGPISVTEIHNENGGDAKVELKAGVSVNIFGNISSGKGVFIEAPESDSATNYIIVDGDITTIGGDVNLVAGGSISVNGSINSSSSSTAAGSVCILANTAAAEPGPVEVFKIGIPSENGVAGTIELSSHENLASSVFLHVKNGGTGGIELTNGNKIVVDSAGGENATILLNCPDGPIRFVGTLSADGSSTVAAGSIYLLCHALETGAGNTSISANDGTETSNTYVVIAASEINFENSNLSIYSDGSGREHQILLLPKNGLEILTSSSPPMFDAVLHLGATGPLKISGTSNFNVRANGRETSIGAYGSPLWFEEGNFTIEANGEDTEVTVEGRIDGEQSNGLKLDSNSFVVSANGSSDNNGGQILVRGESAFISGTAHYSFSANGSGIGDGGFVSFDFGGTSEDDPVVFGVGSSKISASAASGNSGGDGGLISLKSVGIGLTISDNAIHNTILDVGVRGADGLGGFITISADGNLTFEKVVTPVVLVADGSGYGDGGVIRIEHLSGTNNIDFASNGTLKLVANGGVSGYGGTVDVKVLSDLIINSEGFSLQPGTNGDAGNLIVTVGNETHTTAMLTLDGPLSLNGNNEGRGAAINLTATKFLSDGMNISANGGDFGKGGSIALNQTMGELLFDVKGEVESSNFETLGGISYGSGGVVSISSAGPIHLRDGVTIRSNPNADAGDGGEIYVHAGFDEGSTSVLTMSASLQANAGLTGGDGGSIYLQSGPSLSSTPNNSSIILESTAHVSAKAFDEVSEYLGSVEFLNPTGDLIVNAKPGSIVASEFGDMFFRSPISVHVADFSVENAPVSTDTFAGTLNAESPSIKLRVGSAENVHLGSIKGHNVLIRADDISNILRDRGLIESEILTVIAEKGSIGDNSNKLQTSTDEIFPKTNKADAGSIHISNVSSSRLLVNGRTSDETSSVITAGGPVYIESSGCIVPRFTFDVGDSLTFVSLNNSIRVHLASISAEGDITFALGEVPESKIAGTANPDIVVEPGSGQVFWGESPRVFKGMGSVVLTPATGDIVFSAESVTEEIRLEGGIFGRSSTVVAD